MMVAERVETGKRLRAEVSHEAHAEFSPLQGVTRWDSW
jgi:hypothetical protein